MPTLYSRLVQPFVPVVLAILWWSIPHPLSAEILLEAGWEGGQESSHNRSNGCTPGGESKR
jgi:hypothetical protein